MRLAFVLVLGAACGDGLPAPDVVSLDASSGGLVTVRYAGQLVENHRVLFQAADSSIVLATHTDGEGRASAFMPDGGFVTVAIFGLGSVEMFTYAGVKAGDDLVIPDGGHPWTPANILLAVPTAQGATSYRLDTRCDSRDVTAATFSPAPTPMRDCGDGTGVLFVATGTPTPYLYLPAQHFVDGRALTVTGPWTAGQQSAVVVTHVPENIGSVQIDRTLIDHDEIVGGSLDSFGLGVDVDRMVIEKGNLHPAASYRIDVGGFGNLPEAIVRVARWGPFEPSTYVDLGAMMLRPFTSPPAYDPTANTIRWTEGDGAAPNAALVDFSWIRQDTSAELRWTVASARGNEPAIHLPVLPDDLSPTAGSFFSLNQLASFAIDGGYDAGHAHMLSHATFLQFPASGDAGRVTTQVFQQPITE